MVMYPAADGDTSPVIEPSPPRMKVRISDHVAQDFKNVMLLTIS